MYKAALALLLVLSTLSFGSESQSIFITTKYSSQNLYLNQVFTLDVKALIAHDNIESIETTLLNHKGIEIIYEEPFEQVNTHEYKTKIYLQIVSYDAKIPDILLDVKSLDTMTHQMFEGENVQAQDLKGSQYFSRVLAKSLSVANFEASQYNDDYNILQIHLLADTSNLFDFYRKSEFIIEQGVKDIDSFYPITNLTYYAILHKDIKIFEFEYFNLESLIMEKRNIPIRLDEERVSTQTDLTPKSNFLKLYEKMIVTILLLLAFTLFFYRKKLLYLFVALFFVVILIYLFIPTDVVSLKRGSPIKILPTKNSTIFYTTPKVLNVEVLETKEHYKKILLNNKKVGWVDEKHIITD